MIFCQNAKKQCDTEACACSAGSQPGIRYPCLWAAALKTALPAQLSENNLPTNVITTELQGISVATTYQPS